LPRCSGAKAGHALQPFIALTILALVTLVATGALAQSGDASVTQPATCNLQLTTSPAKLPVSGSRLDLNQFDGSGGFYKPVLEDFQMS